jgi:hypothetical protein
MSKQDEARGNERRYEDMRDLAVWRPSGATFMLTMDDSLVLGTHGGRPRSTEMLFPEKL